MKKIEISNWSRKPLFDFFSGMSQPFYSVTLTLDVTALRRFTHEHGLSFYYSLVYLCTQALNRVLSPEFAARARAAKSPYNGGDTSGRIVKILEEKLFEPGFGAPKGFYDGPVRLQGEETR